MNGGDRVTARNERLVRHGTQLLIGLVILAAWQFLPTWLGTSELILPPLSDVLAAADEPLPGGGGLLANTLVTVREITAAFAIAGVAGVMAGVVIGSSRLAGALLQPVLNALFAVPLITLIPMFLVTFGLGEASKIAFGALYAFFPVVFNTTAGVAATDDVYRKVGQAFGLSPFTRLYKIILPGAARQILGGLQTGMAIAIIAVVSAEVFGATAGLGYLIQRSAQSLNGDQVWFVVLVTLALAGFFLALIQLIGKLLRVRPEAAVT